MGAGCCGDDGLLPIKLYLRPVSCLRAFFFSLHTFFEHLLRASLGSLPGAVSAQAGKDPGGDRCSECKEGSAWAEQEHLGLWEWVWGRDQGRRAGGEGHTLLCGGWGWAPEGTAMQAA